MKKIYQLLLFCLLSSSTTTFSQTISSNAPLCGNQNLTLDLSATGGTAYAWKGPNGFASTQQKPSIKNVNWKNRGVYTVTIDSKTTLTTDVNIKDPVAFTVPKEISVCEGGTLLIEPKSIRLTDSTEVADSFQFKFPFYSSTIRLGIIKDFSRTQTGICQVVGFSNNGCSATQNVNVKLNTSSNCKNIQIEDLAMVKMCYGQNIVVPFTTKGNFLQGTKFKVYIVSMFNPSSDDFNKPLMIVDKSPITINIDKYFDQTIAIVMVADDTEKTTSISSYKYFYSKYDYRNNFINAIQTCDSSMLSVKYPNDINSLQWYLNGNVINGANKNDFIAQKSGTYSFKFKGDIARDEIDKTCLYESQPVKIELGKIPKPYVSLSNDIDLCVGKPATLNVFSNTNTKYRWKKDGVFIANATNTNFETLQEGKYQVEAKEGTCSAVSDTVVLRKPIKLNLGIFLINEKYFYNEPSNSAITVCGNSLYDVRFYNYYFDRKMQTQWFKNDVVLKDSIINNTLQNNKGAATYYTKTTYGECTNVSNKIVVNVVNGLNVKMQSNSKSKVDGIFCEGSYDSLYFYVPYYNSNINKIKNYKDIKWYRDGMPYNLVPNFDYPSVIRPKQKGSYYASTLAILEDGTECPVSTDTVSISFSKKVQVVSFGYDDKIKAVPIISCENTTNIREYNDVGIENRAIAYKWTKDGVTLKQDSSSTLQATQEGTYQLETIYKGGCTVVSSPYKVEFGKIDLRFYNPLSVSICDGEEYTLYPSEGDFFSTSKYSLYKDGQLLNINVDVTPPTIYGMRPALTQPGTYKLTVKNGKCEGTSPDFVLKVDKIPTTITPTDSVTFCTGKTVDLKASTEAGLSYIWERNGSVINQANQATLTASADGLYKATLLRGACWGVTPTVKLKTLANIPPTATLTGDQKIDYDKETKLSVSLSSHAPWTFKISDGKEYTATKSPFEIAVKPLSTTTYSLTSVSNICGTGTVSGTAKIEVIILSAEEEKELSVEVFPVPSSEICHWKIQTPEATRASVALYDMTGVTQYTQESAIRTQSHEGTIDLTTLKAGTYFLKLQAGEKSVTRKVVKF